MHDEIKNVYDMLYSHIITPYNLLENAKLPNYTYVKYYKSNDGLIAEMQCTIENEGASVFYYHFDIRDKLIKVVKNSIGSTEVVFDREQELKKSLVRYRAKKNRKKKAAI